MPQLVHANKNGNYQQMASDELFLYKANKPTTPTRATRPVAPVPAPKRAAAPVKVAPDAVEDPVELAETTTVVAPEAVATADPEAVAVRTVVPGRVL
jgi:hypothetical protein